MNDTHIHNATDTLEDIRVGVYICHCGGNISDVIDTRRVVDELAKHPQVVVSNDYTFMCSDPGQSLIIDDIKERQVNRVVISACSPFLHDLTFRGALQRAGLNPYLYEHVNIREQASWVHKGDHEAATDKAIRLTLAGVEKIIRQDPLESIQVNAESHALVIGGGVAGLRAALALSHRGIGSTLVESSSQLGGRMNEMDTVYPTEENAANLIAEMISEAKSSRKIEVLLESEIAGIDGYVGNFQVKIKSKSGEQVQVKTGAIIVATGFDHYKPFEGEFGYGKYPQVVTQPDFIKLLAQASDGKTLQINGKPIKNLAFIHCVGSRQTDGLQQPQGDGKVNDYCSRVCCATTMQTVNKVLDRFPETHVYDLYKDIRTYGRGHEEYYESASKKGAVFFRYNDDALPEVNDSRIAVKDWLTWGEDVEIPYDMVVLATGMMPRDVSDIIGMLKLPVGADRFLLEVHPKLRPVELAVNGVVVAGTCQGPMDINESCAAAEAAAVKVSILLSKSTIELDPFVARVDAGRCEGCGLCVPECSYEGALTLSGGIVNVNPALCSGCGACVAVCPRRAIDVAGWSLDQFDAMVDAIVGQKADKS